MARETTGNDFLILRHFSRSMNKEFDLIFRSCSSLALFWRRSCTDLVWRKSREKKVCLEILIRWKRLKSYIKYCASSYLLKQTQTIQFSHPDSLNVCVCLATTNSISQDNSKLKKEKRQDSTVKCMWTVWKLNLLIFNSYAYIFILWMCRDTLILFRT